MADENTNTNLNANADVNLNANANPPAAPYAICSYLFQFLLQFLVLLFRIDMICLSVLDVIYSSILLVRMISLILQLSSCFIIGYIGLNLMVNCLYF
jgi:hypothetical protein